jgi:tripartite-type tricarboxylate transporter receptor subunit TctC
MAGVKILAIPYKGGAPALTAVLAGDIPMSINPMPEVVGQLDSGLVRDRVRFSVIGSAAIMEIEC